MPPPPGLPPVDRIGDFRILRALGEGGMGTVYEAEQDNPRRRVALKVVRAARMTPELIKRFEREAHVLGLLQHPGIAQIYQAGTADSGDGPQPYFAMELVHGRPLGEHARVLGLSVRQRLELLARVCDALQHAHQKGIVHRDLKPGNVLVVAHDASTSSGGSTSLPSSAARLDDVAHVGQPKILDFGLARITESDLPATTLQTEVGQLLGTVQYMSPEQVVGDSAQIDARSDIYAMGVIAYELLSGRAPYELRGGPMLEALRKIREEEPAPLGSTDRALRGDVATIVAKALEKDPARRYATAADMAADIRRCLRNEPIVARPPSAVYQLRKFAARNKVLVGGVVAVFLALVAGLIGTAMGYVEARKNERLAIERGELAREREREAVRARDEATRARDEAAEAKLRADDAAAQAEAINTFLVKDLLTGSDPSAAKGRTITLDEVLENAREHADEVFQDQPLLSARLHSTLGEIEYHLGRNADAERHFRLARDTRSKARGVDARETLDAQQSLASTLRELDRTTEALELQSFVVDCMRRKDDQRGLVSALCRLGQIQSERGDATGARETYNEALGILEALPPEMRGNKTTLPTMLSDRASLLTRAGHHDEARADYERALELYRAFETELHPDVVRIKGMLASVTRVQNDPRRAIAEYQDVLAAQRQIFKTDHPDVAQTLSMMGQTACDLGNYAQAQSWLEESLAIGERLGVGDEVATCGARVKLSRALNGLGQFNAAAVVVERAIAIFDRHPDARADYKADALIQLAITRRFLSQFEAAKQATQRALEIRGSMATPDPQSIIQAKSMLAQCLHGLKQYDEADALYREVLELYEQLEGRNSTNVAVAYTNLAGLSLERDRAEEALADLRAAVEIATAVYPADHPDLAFMRTNLGRALHRTKRLSEALEILNVALETQRAKLPAGHISTLATLVELGETLTESGRASEAEPLLREAVEGRRRIGGAKFARATQALGECLVAQERREEAESLLLESQSTWAALPNETEAAARAARCLADLYAALGRPEDAARWSALAGGTR